MNSKHLLEQSCDQLPVEKTDMRMSKFLQTLLGACSMYYEQFYPSRKRLDPAPVDYWGVYVKKWEERGFEEQHLFVTITSWIEFLGWRHLVSKAFSRC
jgi:hypothetical protein